MYALGSWNTHADSPAPGAATGAGSGGRVQADGSVVAVRFLHGFARLHVENVRSECIILKCWGRPPMCELQERHADDFCMRRTESLRLSKPVATLPAPAAGLAGWRRRTQRPWGAALCPHTKIETPCTGVCLVYQCCQTPFYPTLIARPSRPESMSPPGEAGACQ